MGFLVTGTLVLGTALGFAVGIIELGDPDEGSADGVTVIPTSVGTKELGIVDGTLLGITDGRNVGDVNECIETGVLVGLNVGGFEVGMRVGLQVQPN